MRLYVNSAACPSYPQILVPLVLAAVLLVLAERCEYSSDVEIRRRGGEVSLRVEAGELTAKADSKRVVGLQILALRTVYPLGGTRLMITDAGGLVVDDPLPRRFPIPITGAAALADWAVDPSAGSGVAYERRISLDGDFTLKTRILGRTPEYVTFVLKTDGGEQRYRFRRGFLNSDFLIEQNGKVEAITAVTTLPRRHLAAVAEIVLRSAAAAALLVLVFRLLRLAFAASTASAGARPTRRAARLTAVALAGAGLAVRIFVATRILERLPHTPDETTYLLQARWLAAGKLWEAAQPFQKNLTLPFTFTRDGAWFGMYPVGWPLLLAPAELLRLGWLVAPLCGAALVVVAYLLAAELWDETTGIAAAMLTAFSPMAILMSGSLLSHSAAALLVGLFLWLSLRALRTRCARSGILAGVSVGLSFSIRPLTAVAVVAASAPFLLGRALGSPPRVRKLLLLVFVAIGGVAGTAPALFDNWKLTKSPFVFAYTYGAGVGVTLDQWPLGLQILDSTLASVPPALHGWGWGFVEGWPILALAIGVALVPIVSGRAGASELQLALVFAAIPAAYVTVPLSGLHGYGPRYYYEGFLALYLLGARGFALLARENEPAPRPVAAAAWALALVLVASNLVRLPTRLALYKGYNGVGSELEAEVARLKPNNALIVFRDDTWHAWAQAGNLFRGDLRADPAFAAHAKDDTALDAFYAGRERWLYDRSLRPMSIPMPAPAAASAR